MKEEGRTAAVLGRTCCPKWQHGTRQMDFACMLSKLLTSRSLDYSNPVKLGVFQENKMCHRKLGSVFESCETSDGVLERRQWFDRRKTTISPEISVSHRFTLPPPLSVSLTLIHRSLCTTSHWDLLCCSELQTRSKVFLVSSPLANPI